MQIEGKLDIVRRIMKLLSSFIFAFLFTPQSFAQTEPSANELLPLRSCAYSVSTLIEGRKIPADWSSENEDSFYFLNCLEDYDKGQDIYVYTPKGVYYFFVKSHKPYKGGLEATQFRLSLENETYYFKANIVGGLGNLYDRNGSNLRSDTYDPEDLKLDVSQKNPALIHYMKVITGSADPKSAVVAAPATGERLLKAQACIRTQVMKLSSDLVGVYLHRVKYKQVPPETLATYKAYAETVLTHPACSMDAVVADGISKLLVEIRK